MTDPLSVTVSVLTLIAACTTCAKQVNSLARGFRDAPREILVLSNEISDMSVVLMEINAICHDPATMSKLVKFFYSLS